MFRVLDHAGERTTLRGLMPLLYPDRLQAHMRELPKTTSRKTPTPTSPECQLKQRDALQGLRDRLAPLVEREQNPYLELETNPDHLRVVLVRGAHPRSRPPSFP